MVMTLKEPVSLEWTQLRLAGCGSAIRSKGGIQEQIQRREMPSVPGRSSFRWLVKCVVGHSCRFFYFEVDVGPLKFVNLEHLSDFT